MTSITLSGHAGGIRQIDVIRLAAQVGPLHCEHESMSRTSAVALRDITVPDSALVCRPQSLLRSLIRFTHFP
jgi:hypothetical protein